MTLISLWYDGVVMKEEHQDKPFISITFINVQFQYAGDAVEVFAMAILLEINNRALGSGEKAGGA